MHTAGCSEGVGQEAPSCHHLPQAHLCWLCEGRPSAVHALRCCHKGAQVGAPQGGSHHCVVSAAATGGAVFLQASKVAGSLASSSSACACACACCSSGRGARGQGQAAAATAAPPPATASTTAATTAAAAAAAIEGGGGASPGAAGKGGGAATAAAATATATAATPHPSIHGGRRKGTEHSSHLTEAEAHGEHQGVSGSVQQPTAAAAAAAAPPPHCHHCHHCHCPLPHCHWRPA